jgi:hypothetical protein
MDRGGAGVKIGIQSWLTYGPYVNALLVQLEAINLRQVRHYAETFVINIVESLLCAEMWQYELGHEHNFS